jgi:hypothetical protein
MSETPPVDPINAELERALFKRFWTWLAIVGSVVFVFVSGFSVIASLAINSLVNERVTLAIEKVKHLEDVALESALKINDAQARSSVASEEAKSKSIEGQKAVSSLQEAIKALPNVDSLVRSTQEIASSLAKNPQFATDVFKGLGGGRILAMAQIKDGKLISRSDGVAFDRDAGRLSFPNPKRLTFVPVVSDFNEGVYITDTHFIRALGPDNIIVWSKPLDTGGRNGPPP